MNRALCYGVKPVGTSDTASAGNDRRFWLMVIGDTNCDLLAKVGRPYYALNRSNIALSIKPGDRCILYRARTGKGIVGIYEVNAPVTNTPTSVGVKTYAIRIPWKALLLCETDPVELSLLAPRLNFIQNKGNYGTYFRTILRRLAFEDFATIEDAVRQHIKTEP